jgi:hypothetical protein
MSNGSDEIAEIRKRLEAIEKAINELRAGNLAMMQIMAALGRTTQGPEKTGAAAGTADKPPQDITGYAQAEKVESAGKAVEKVDNAEDAMAVANAFMKKDNSVALPLKAVRRDEVWVVDVDIGEVRMEIVRVKIDAKTGGILSHETIEKK